MAQNDETTNIEGLTVLMDLLQGLIDNPLQAESVGKLRPSKLNVDRNQLVKALSMKPRGSVQQIM